MGVLKIKVGGTYIPVRQGARGPSGAISGEIKMWPGASAPADYLLCKGAFVSQATYPALFALFGHSFNSGVDPGNGTFKLPDYSDKAPVGAGANHALGSSYGTTWDHTHLHSVPGHEHWNPGVDHQHSHQTHTHAVGSLTIASAADRAAGTGNRGANPISGRTGTVDQYTETSAADRALGVWTNSNQLSATNNATPGEHPRVAINFIIKT